MKIAIIGAHSCGKTTLAYHLAARLKSMDKSVGVVIEQARLCPFDLQTREAAEWLIINQIKQEQELTTGHDVIVSDRSTLDTLAYAKVNNVNIYTPLITLSVEWAFTYDAIIYLEPSRTIVNDGFRDMDEGYRDKTVTEFEKVLAEHLHSNILYYRNDKSSCEQLAMELIELIYKEEVSL